MSTFLQLAQKVNTLSGTQGTISSVSATGHQAVIVEIVKSAWTDIQNLRPDWDFLKVTSNLSTVVGQTSYDVTDLFGIGGTNIIGSWRGIVKPDLTQAKKVSMDYYILKDLENLDQTSVNYYSWDAINNLLYINPPDAVYSLGLYYYRKPQVLSTNVDVPLGPTELHDAIVYRALVDLGSYIGSADLYQSYLTKSDALIGSLMRSQLPAKRIRTIGIV